MRMKVLLLVIATCVLGAPELGHAEAEKVRTNQNAKLYNRPGEQGKVLIKLKEGRAMRIIAKDGRWLKVRVAGRTGYIPRSKVDMPADDEITRNTRRRPFVDGRGTKRGFGGSDTAPEDRIGADATGDNVVDDDDDDDDDEPVASKPKPKPKPKAKPTKGSDDDDDDDDEPVASSGGSDDDDDDDEPADDGDEGDDEDDEDDGRVRVRVSSKATLFEEADEDSDESFKATPSDVLYVLERKGSWILVETDEGDVGYVQASLLDEGSSGGSRSRIIDVRGRLGVTLMSQSMNSAGGSGTWPDKYRLGSSAAAISLGGTVLYPYKKDFLLGGEVTYDIAKAIPGIAFDPDGGGAAGGPLPAATTGFTMHNLNVRGVAGYDFKKKSGLVALGRLGYHYESLLISNVIDLNKNNARLPSEVIKGPMIGAAMVMPRLTDKIGVRVNLDAMVVGASVTQTKNLEDGANPSAKRITFGTAVTYRWKPTMDIQAGYDLNYASLSFGAPVAASMRMHTGTGVARTDINHTVAVGVARTF